MRITLLVLAGALAGCSVQRPSLDGFACASDEDCAAGVGHVCILDPASGLASCAAPGSVPGGVPVDGEHDAGPAADAGAPDDGGGPAADGGLGADAGAPRDAGALDDAGAAEDDAGAPDGGEPPPDAGAATFPGGFLARVQLTVDEAQLGGAEPLVDFPLYVRLTDAALAHTESGGVVRSLLGDDLEVRLPDAASRLDHEIERYAPEQGELEMWVRVPSLSTTEDTVLYVYFGSDLVSGPLQDPEGVWGADHRAVWHLAGPKADGAIVPDSTGANPGEMRNTEESDDTPGVVGAGVRFNNDDEAIYISSDELDIGDSFTVEAWARLDGLGSSYPRIYQKGTASGGRAVELFVEDGWGSQLGRTSFRTSYLQDASWPRYTPPQFNLGEWYHYVGVFDDDTDQLHLYINGALVLTEEQDAAPATGTSDHWIGNWNDSYFDSRDWDGAIDEVRVSSVVRSPEWIAAGYANVSAPDTFVWVGPVQLP